LKEKKVINFFTPKKENGIGQWLAEEGISAGFPSPADDFKETRISLDRELVKNKEATFYARVSGDSMVGAGLDDGDLLVIDRSKNPENGKIAICLVDGEFTVKRIKKEKNKLYLMPENKKYEPIELREENELIIWGVVQYVIKKVWFYTKWLGLLGRLLKILLTNVDLGNIITQAVIKINKKSIIIEEFFKYHNSSSVL